MTENVTILLQNTCYLDRQDANVWCCNKDWFSIDILEKIYIFCILMERINLVDEGRKNVDRSTVRQ